MSTDLSTIFGYGAKKPTMAELLMKQGIDTSPTPSWGAAVARALQGGLAGVYDKQDTAAEGKQFDAMFGGTPSTTQPPPPRFSDLGETAGSPTPPAAVASNSRPSPAEPDMGPPPGVRQGGMTIGNVMSAEPAPADYHPQDYNLDTMRPPDFQGAKQRLASLLQGEPMPQSAPPVSPPQQAAPLPPLAAQAPQQPPQPPQQVAQAAPVPMPAQGTPQQRQAPQIPPDVLARAKSLWMGGDPQGKAAATAILQPYMTPKDQYAPLVDPQERARRGIDPGDKTPYQVELATGKASPINPSAQTNVSVNSVADPIREGVGKQFDASLKNARTSARSLIPEIHDARAALDQGTVTGQFADPRLVMQKIGALFGMPGDQASNTEVFRATIGRQVLAHAKELGANPSNTDRDFIKAVEGGKGDLEETTMRRLLDLSEKYARQGINFHNADADKLIAANPDAYKSIAGVMKVDQPQQYQATAKQAPSSGQPASGAGKVRRYNPATGKIE